MQDMINRRVMLIFRQDVFGRVSHLWIHGMVLETDAAGILFQPEIDPKNPLSIGPSKSEPSVFIEGKVFFPWSVVGLIQMIDETKG